MSSQFVIINLLKQEAARFDEESVIKLTKIEN